MLFFRVKAPCIFRRVSNVFLIPARMGDHGLDVLNCFAFGERDKIDCTSRNSRVNSLSTSKGGTGGSGAGIKAWYPSSCFTYFPARIVIFL
jgi:hypothetical protein